MNECEICLEAYPEDILELHRKSCVLQMILRCSICNEDYVSREGLWNHLDVHEISDDSKESHCQELKAKHKLHQCTLCNDQRGYSESSYEMHIHDFHSSSKAQDGTVASEVNTPERKPETIERENREAQSMKSSETRDQQLKEKPGVSFGSDTGNNLNSNSELSTENANRKKSTEVRKQCTSCGNIYSSRWAFDRHKKACSVGRQYECRSCSKTYRCRTDYTAHNKICKQRMYLCSLCGRTFKWFKSVKRHITTNHPQTGCLDTVQIVPKQVRSKVPEKKTSLEDTAVPAPDNGEQSTMDVLDSQPNAASCDNGSVDSQTASKDRSKEKQVTSVNRKRSYPCRVCDMTFNCYNSFVKHRMAEHTEAKYQCTHCSKKYLNKRNLDVHICDKERRRKCDLCDRWFLNPKNLESHKIKKHLLKTKVLAAETRAGLDDTIKLKDKPLEDDKEISSSDQEATEVLQCQMCEQQCKNVRILEYHTTVAHTEPQYECSQCQKKFHYVRFLRVHHKRASKTRCQKCDINFCSRDQLIYHCSEKHPEDCTLKDLVKYKINKDGTPNTDGTFWPCSICKQLFRKRSQQHYHMIKHHKEPKYKCCFCGKMFHFRMTLRRHEKVCLAMRCQECDIVFTTRVLLKKHKLNMHPEDGKSNNSETTTTGTLGKATKVEDRKRMSKSLKRRNNRMVSQTADRSLSCSICGLTFPNTYGVWYHKILAHAPPKFKCPYCQKAFHFQRNLDRHDKTCSKMRCCRCSIMFPSRAVLDIHNKNMHSTDDDPMNVEAEEELVSEIKIEEERLPEDAEEFAL